jgi:hypothetical protein
MKYALFLPPPVYTFWLSDMMVREINRGGGGEGEGELHAEKRESSLHNSVRTLTY